MADSTPDNGAIRSFGQFLQALQEGSLHGDLTAKLQEITATLNNVRAEEGGTPKARIAIAIEFALDKFGKMAVAADFTVKLPVPARGKTDFFTTADNHLSRRNPRQMELGLRDATPARAAEDIRTA